MHHVKKYKYSDIYKSKMCGTREDRYHLFQCNHENQIKWRRSLVSTIRAAMEKQSTDHILSDTISRSVIYWLDKGQVQSGMFSPEIRYAINDKNEIV